MGSPRTEHNVRSTIPCDVESVAEVKVAGKV